MRENLSELPQCKRGSNLAPGELRSRQNWIGPAGCALHEAPLVSSPFQQVANDMPLPERLIHAVSKLPVPVKIGPAQFQFETTRPFLHGAFRVGRLLITLLHCEQGALQNRFSTYPGTLSRIVGGIAKNCNRFAMPELGSSGSPFSPKESCRQADRRSIRREEFSSFAKKSSRSHGQLRVCRRQRPSFAGVRICPSDHAGKGRAAAGNNFFRDGQRSGCADGQIRNLTRNRRPIPQPEFHLSRLRRAIS